jgi:transketolase
MMSAAAGLTLADKIPFVCTYAVFSSMRACEQVRTDIAYNGLPVRIVSTHGGFSFGIAGATHHAIEDIGINRVFSGMTVLVPADGVETASIIRALMNLKGPAYVRLSRIKEKQVYEQDFEYKIGQPDLLKEGKDILLIATGGQVGESLEAAELLGKHDVDAGVMNISTIKPMDQKAVVSLIDGYPYAMTIEEHNIINGLGSAVAEVIALNNLDIQFKIHGLYDEFTTSGPYRDMLHYYRLDGEGICETALKFLDEN